MANVGFRICSKINRPPKELIQAFAGFPVANIADNMGRLFCVNPEIVPTTAPSCSAGLYRQGSCRRQR